MFQSYAIKFHYLIKYMYLFHGMHMTIVQNVIYEKVILFNVSLTTIYNRLALDVYTY